MRSLPSFFSLEKRSPASSFFRKKKNKERKIIFFSLVFFFIKKKTREKKQKNIVFFPTEKIKIPRLIGRVESQEEIRKEKRVKSGETLKNCWYQIDHTCAKR